MTSHHADLRSLMNVGPKVERYLHELAVRSIDDLVHRNADELFRRLQRRIGTACDPCLHDTFAAIIHEAQTGEKTPWFAWTAERKRRVVAGELDLRIPGPSSVKATRAPKYRSRRTAPAKALRA